LLQKVEGIVIRTTNYGETNKIITLLTREFGKVGVMARGAKKPKSRLTAVTQLFTYGQFLIQKGKGLGTLQQGEVVSTMRHIREDIILTAYAAYSVELTDKLTEEGAQNPFLFELLYQVLNFMNEGIDPEILTHIFEMKMLDVAGIHPQLNGCAYCGNREGNFAFSIREGGFLCERCYHRDPHHYKISNKTARLLRLFYYFDLNRLGSISISIDTKQELKTIISAFYDEYSGLNLKSKRFLQQIAMLEEK
jgi:DNA repair protein RecO (recombination protein O)